MICPYCKKEINDNSTFCEYCGQAVNHNSDVKQESDKFWEKENLEKQKEVQRVRQEQKEAESRRKSRGRAVVVSLIVIAAIAALIYYSAVIVPMNQYEEAQVLLQDGKYEEALSIFNSLGSDYENSARFIQDCESGITENNYIAAIETYNSKDYASALRQFENLSSYKDSNKYIANCEVEILSVAEKNDIVQFGDYSWIVLDKSSTDILLVSESYVDKRLANEYTGSSKYGKYRCWSQSTLRSWLNGSFISDAFSSEERDLLKINKITTPEYNVDGYDGWNEQRIDVTTEDKVYIPSIADVENYNIKPIPATSSSGYYNRYDDDENPGWLRDRGHGIAFQSTLNSDGSDGSEWHHYSSYGVRPIIRVNIG